MVEHPRSMLDRAVELLKWKRNAELSRCAKACFFDADGKTVTQEGERLLADLRKDAKLFNSSIRRIDGGAIDREDMLRIEGRREIVLKLINLLELDPLEVARFVEVENDKL